MNPRRAKRFIVLVDETIAPLATGTDIAPLAGGMTINGIIPVTDMQLQEDLSGATTEEEGGQAHDFSALLFLLLVTSEARAPRIQEEAEGPAAGVSSARNSATDSGLAQSCDTGEAMGSVAEGSISPAQTGGPESQLYAGGEPLSLLPMETAEILDAPLGFGNSIEAAEPLVASGRTDKSQSQPNGVDRASDETSWQVVESSPNSVTSLRVSGSFQMANAPGDRGREGGSGAQGGLSPSMESPMADASGFNPSVLDSPTAIVAQDLGVAAMGPAESTQAISRGYSVYAKDDFGQRVSSLSDKPVLSGDGVKSGRLSQTPNAGEANDRATEVISQLVGDVHGPESQQSEHGSFFQDKHRDFGGEPTQTTDETAQSGGVAFHLAHGIENAPPPVRREGPAQWRPVMDRIAGEISGHIRIGKTEAVIQLDPPELGRLKINLQLDGQKIEARIMAETHESRALIESHLPELRQALGESRVQLVNVRIDGGNWGGAAGDGRHGAWQESQGGSRSFTDFAGTGRDGGENHDPVRDRAIGREIGRVSMWA